MVPVNLGSLDYENSIYPTVFQFHVARKNKFLVHLKTSFLYVISENLLLLIVYSNASIPMQLKLCFALQLYCNLFCDARP